MTSIPKSGGSYQASTGATPDAVAVRDSEGNLVGATVTGDNGIVSAGVFATKLLAKTANYTLDDAETVVSFDASGGARTATLPPAADVTNRIYIIQKIDTSVNIVTVDGDSSETVGGLTTWLLYNAGDTVAVQSDGSNWLVLWWKASMAVLTQTGSSLTVSSQPTPITYLCDTSSNSITANLPSAATSKGLVRYFKKIHASNTMTIEGDSTDQVEGGNNVAVTDNLDARNIVCNGTAWYVLNGFG